jgi:hypothetical protein
MYLVVPLFSLHVLAQGSSSDGTYTVLEPLPGFGQGSKVVTRTNLLGNYLENAYTLVLQAAAIICVISIMVGGIQYITAAAADTKSAARARIWRNFTGFLIVLAAYLLLYTINPNLVKFKLEIPKIATSGSFAGPGTFLIYDEQTGVYKPSTQILGPQTSAGSSPGDEFTVRKTLEDSGFSIPNQPCNGKISGCTDVGNLRQGTIDGIITEKNNCGCTMIITGGSEVGNGHSLPQAGNNYMAHSNGFKVDVASSAQIRNYVKSEYTYIKKTSDGPLYLGISNGVPVQVIDEGNHFDFLFNTK